MTTPLPTEDDTYLKDAQSQRDHAEQLATIEANRARDLARIARERADERRTAQVVALVCVLIAALVVAIVVAVYRYNTGGRAHDEQMERVRQETAQVCIRAGNIWLNGNCVPAQRPAG